MAKGGEDRLLAAHGRAGGTLVERITLKERQVRMVDLKPCRISYTCGDCVGPTLVR